MDSLSFEVFKSNLSVFLKVELQFKQQWGIWYWEHLVKSFGPTLWRNSDDMIIIIFLGLKCYISMKH